MLQCLESSRSISLDSLRAGNRPVLFSTPNLAKGGVD